MNFEQSYPVSFCITLLEQYIFYYKQVKIKVKHPSTSKEIELFEKAMIYVIPWFEQRVNITYQ